MTNLEEYLFESGHTHTVWSEAKGVKILIKITEEGLEITRWLSRQLIGDFTGHFLQFDGIINALHNEIINLW